MTFSQYAGTAIVPTLSRLVLGAVFILAGYSKVFKSADFTHEQAQKLFNAGIRSLQPKQPVGSAWLPDNSNAVRLASYRQETTATQPADVPDQVETPPPTTAPSTPEIPATQPATAPPGSFATLAPGTYTGPQLHFITLMLIDAHWRYASLLAHAAAYTELIGGVMILIGLFSRLWGLALSCVMGVAFYLTSLPVLQTTAILEMGEKFGSISLQLALFVLAFGILLTGPGPLSLDRLLFSRSEPVIVDEKKRT